jgi:tRNA/tmRNA/rRNA uracil-C5-methylase (TrmA/RlmC/RlmD family)
MNKKKSAKENFSFEKTLRDLSSFKWDSKSPDPLATLDYKQECELKNKSFATFLSASGIKVKPRNLIASPKARHYRTTTKRRVYCDRHGLGLGFVDSVKPGVVSESDLEPPEHLQIYKFLRETLSDKKFSSLARALNWLIIRGSYERQFLILNIFQMNAGIVRKLKQLTELLKQENLVEGAMSYFDPTRSDYYLESERPPRGLQIKHLFGPRFLGLRVNEVLMRYSPTGFSQINESMLPEMIKTAESMLAPQAEDQLLDLYCGYGLFSHTVGSVCQKVTGVELSKDAIESAQQISKRLQTRKRMSFHAEKIDASLVRNKFEPATQSELILLDPPRKGCESGVIAQLAQRKPKRVLHIFCGTDEIPGELKQWQQHGYIPKIIQPLDMFAGTANLETMVLLEGE